jgi:hypothetical protein
MPPGYAPVLVAAAGRPAPELAVAACLSASGFVLAACGRASGFVAAACGRGLGFVAAACGPSPEFVLAACRPGSGRAGALGSFGPLGGTGLSGPECGGASLTPGGSSAGGTGNPVLFAAGRNHRPDSPSPAGASPVAALAMSASLAASAGLAASPGLPASPGLAVLFPAALAVSGRPAPDPRSAGDAGPAPSETSGAARKATSASVNSVPVFVLVLSSAPVLLFLAVPPFPAAPPSSAAPLSLATTLSSPSPGAPPAPAMPSSGSSAQVMSSPPSLSGSAATDLPLPSSVAGRRDGTRLKYRSGRTPRANTRVARKWSPIFIVPVQRAMTAPRAQRYRRRTRRPTPYPAAPADHSHRNRTMRASPPDHVLSASGSGQDRCGVPA